MTVANNYQPIRQLGNGTTTAFSFNFRVLEDEQIVVYELPVGGEQQIVDSDDYTVNLTNSGGEVVFNNAPAAGTVIVITRDTPQTQETPYKTSQGFPAAVVEGDFDKLTMMVQELQQDSDRSVKVDVTSGVTPEVLVNQVERVWSSIDNVDTVADNASNINAVAGDLSNIDAAVANASNINAAVANEANINAAVANEANINAAVANEANINAAVANEANINAVAGNMGDVVTVAAQSADVAAVAAVSGDLGDIIANETNINTVATNISDVNTTAGSIANINNVGGSISNVNAVAADLSNVDIVAGVSQQLSVIYPVVETYINGTEWYRVYSDGWVEQGGEYTTAIASNSSVQITLLKPFIDTNYNVQVTGRFESRTDGSGAIAMGAYAESTTLFSIVNDASVSNNKGAFWQACGYGA